MSQYHTKQYDYPHPAIGVVGGRDFNDYNLLCATLNHHIPIGVIVSGGASGTDTLAARYAIEHKVPLIEHIPNWDRYGKSAAMLRNAYIVRDSDLVIAFWDGQSRGTANTIARCKDAAKPCHIIKY